MGGKKCNIIIAINTVWVLTRSHFTYVQPSIRPSVHICVLGTCCYLKDVVASEVTAERILCRVLELIQYFSTNVL